MLVLLIFLMILYSINLRLESFYLKVGIVLGLLKTSNLLARHFSSMFHAKCLLPRQNRLLPQFYIQLVFRAPLFITLRISDQKNLEW